MGDAFTDGVCARLASGAPVALAQNNVAWPTNAGPTCDACACKFKVEFAAQVLFTGGRRHYACSPICRRRDTRSEAR